MTWTVDDAGAYVVVRTAGTFGVADHLAMVKDIVSRPFWRSGRDAFFDHRSLAFEGTGYAEMNAAAATHRGFDEQIGAGRAAILMNNRADYGVGRIFDLLTEDGVLAVIRVFTDAAEAWLKTPRNSIEADPA
jgi:hypothetical protein